MFSPELLESIKQVKRGFEIISIELLDHEKLAIHLIDKLFQAEHTVSIPEINDVFQRLLLDYSPEEAMLQIGEVLMGKLHRYNFVRYFVSNGVILCDN